MRATRIAEENDRLRNKVEKLQETYANKQSLTKAENDAASATERFDSVKQKAKTDSSKLLQYE